MDISPLNTCTVLTTVYLYAAFSLMAVTNISLSTVTRKFFINYLFILKSTRMKFMLNYKLAFDFVTVGFLHRNERPLIGLDS